MQDETIHKNNVRHPEHAENARKGGAHLIDLNPSLNVT
ncbi:hypothetical protein MCEGE14_00588 [Burkholderiaceae bacterium]